VHHLPLNFEITPLKMEGDDLHSTLGRGASHSGQLSARQIGPKSTTAAHSRDRSIDQEDSPIFARKTSVGSPQSTAAQKDTTTTRQRFQPVFRSKGMRHSVSNIQSASMGPPIATLSSVRRSTASSAIHELHSTPTAQHSGSQASSLIPGTYVFRC
jgi:hypothetical protein